MNGKNDIDWGGWILTVIMLGVFWPIGLVLLFRQLMGYNRRGRHKQIKRHPVDVAREQQAQARYAQTAQRGAQAFTQGVQAQGAAQRGAQAFTQGAQAQGAARWGAQAFTQGAQAQGRVHPGEHIRSQYGQTRWNTQPQPGKDRQQAWKTQGKAAANQGGWEAVKQSAPRKRSGPERKTRAKGTLLSVIGGILTGVFGLAAMVQVTEIIGDLVNGYGIYGYDIQSLLVLSGFLGAGLVTMFAGRSKRKQALRYKKYLSYIGKNQEISISALTAAMGGKQKQVCQDLQDMLDNGILPMGYIDVAEGMLILSDEGIAPAAPEPKAGQEAEPEPVKKVVEDENAILQEIREVNDAIPDEAMSAKIDRIGEITGKILDYQRSHPSKSGQLRSFLNYYLPTTLKVLRAYAQLDAQGIEGENISAAKKRIENMMDQVVNGFEKQLDKLFADDALDITADVAVLENMLRKDGLSGEGLTAGAAPGAAGNGAFSAQQAYLDLQKVADELENQKKTGQDDGQITLSL